MTAAPAAASISITRRTLDLEDYIDIARRHIGWILGPAYAGLVISIVVAFLIPNVYVSGAEMEITPAQVSSNLVPAAVTQQLTDRLIFMENEILSRSNLAQLIQDPRLDLYKAERAKEPLDDVIEKMLGDISIQMGGFDGGGRRASSFKIYFAYPNRVKARDTVAMLVTSFMNANVRAQRQVQATVNGFTSQQVADAKAELDKFDKALADFRAKNPGRLPEQSGINMSELQTLNNQLAASYNNLNRLAQEKANLQTHLQTVNSQIENYRLFTGTNPEPGTSLAEQGERLASLNRTITDDETQLNMLRKTFKETYPDVKEYEQRLQVLRTERDALRKRQQAAEKERMQDFEAKKGSDTPMTVSDLGLAQRMTDLKGEVAQIQTSLRLNEIAVANEMKWQEKLTKDIEIYKERLAATNGLEAEYTDLLRQERLASGKYDDLLHKQDIVDQNVDLVQRQAGEQLNVLDPASLPEKPARPNRLKYIEMGFGVSLMIGIALAGMQEARDTSLKNLKDVRAYTNLPVLSSIPLLENSVLVRRKRRLAYLAWSAGTIAGVIAVSSALYYHFLLAA